MLKLLPNTSKTAQIFIRPTLAQAQHRDALECFLRDTLGNVTVQAAAAIFADAVADLVASGRWSPDEARTVVYTADRRIDRVAS